MALPLVMPSNPVFNRVKLKVPELLLSPVLFSPSPRYSMPNLSVCAPRTQLNRSLTMYDGRKPAPPALPP